MKKTVRLFSYKMTNDTGFAPNPFHGIITLSCCKPGIRKTKKVGDWVAGFTSKSLIYQYNQFLKKHGLKNYRRFNGEELIFLMQVEKKMSFNEFWKDPDFGCKKPNNEYLIAKTGDNIYSPNPYSYYEYKQIKNPNHDENSIKRDLSGLYVLASKKFYYFGINSLKLDSSIAPKIPKTQTYYGIRTHDESQSQVFIEYIQAQYSTGMHGHPFMWPVNDDTWREYESNSKQERV